jgi:branched-chain amino acid transport system ATP-binding protein
MNLLTVKSVGKSYGGVVANHDVSLTVPKGKIVGVIGPNGSGKTTLFNSIVGHHAIDSGEIHFNGQEISALTIPEIARLGMLRTFQQTHIYGKMSCVQNMQISSDIDARWRIIFSPFSKEIDERVDELLAFVGLYKKRFLLAGDLSFGQQKLLEFAMALMKKPKMLLLDEPTAGVNPTLINGLIDRLQQVNEEMGITLLVIEHNMRVIMNLAEHIYCVAGGTMLAEGKPVDIQNDQRVIDAYLGN